MILAYALALGFTGLASASPLFSSTCMPNFQGRTQTVHKQPDRMDRGAYEWSPTNAVGGHITLVAAPKHEHAADEFIVEFTGQPRNTYQFKLVANTEHNLALTAGPHGDLAFAIVSGSSIPSQEFSIACENCPETGSSGGNMQAKECVVSHPSTDTCVTGNEDGEVLRLAPCDGSSQQTYAFWDESSR